MNKRTKYVIISTIIFIFILFYTYTNKRVNNYELGIAGALVIEKEVVNNNYFISVDHFDENRNIITTKINITNENLWNLIEVNEFYTISYFDNKKSNSFTLNQIEPNIDFKNIYSSKFKNYKR